MFIRKRKSSRSREFSHQVIETYRDGGKVKQRVLANLGRFDTVEAALDHANARLQRLLSHGPIEAGYTSFGRFLSIKKAEQKRQYIFEELTQATERVRRLQSVATRIVTTS